MSTIYSPLARIVPRGATLPGSPADGMLWLHNPAGRVLWMKYANGQWNPIQSFGPMAVYVDTANGTDSQNKGYGTGANAFATVQFAVNQIPGLVGGNVTVNIAAGTYREQVTVQGKSFTGPYGITLQGVKGTDALADTVATGGANPVGNGSAGFGTVTKTGATWTANAFAGKLLEVTSGTGAGQIVAVHANTATVITIVGQWGTVPDSTSHFHVFDAGTRITGSNAGADTTPVRDTCVTVQNGQQGVTLNMLKLDYANNIACAYVQTGGNLTLSNCQLAGAGNAGAYAQYFATLTLLTVTSSGATLYDVKVQDMALLYAANLRLASAGAGVTNLYVTNAAEVSYLTASYLGKGTAGTGPDKCLYLELCARVSVGDQCEFDGGTVENVHVTTNSVLGTSQLYTPGSTVSKNSGGWGVLSATGGFGQTVSTNFTYSGNASGTYSPVTAPAGGNT